MTPRTLTELAARVRREPRRNVLLWAVLLGLWLLVPATHFHAGEDHERHGGQPVPCNVCLGFAAAAGPPVLPQQPTLHPEVVAAEVWSPAAWWSDRAPSSYRSRAPPAA